MKRILFVLLFLSLLGSIITGSKEDWKKRTIYQLLTDRFSRTDGSTSPCSNFKLYCGGTFVGIKNHLDYIQGMGFDAIWISPIIDNFEDGYHGYWAKNFTDLNSNFGTKQEFKDLVDECHKRGIWVMVDIVANHVGPCEFNYSRVVPFNQDSHYHTYCTINPDDWQHNQWRVENCRLAGLPDLKQEDNFVNNALLSWISDLVKTYNIDGLRVDTVPEVPKSFWDSFSQAAGVFTMGEVFDDRLDYINGYWGHVDAVFNFPLSYKIKNTFKGSSFLDNIISTMEAEMALFGNNFDYIGNFFDNHDLPRFMNYYWNDNNLIGAMAFILFIKGIPIIYYGDEQQYDGGNDPNNREPLWTHMNTNHPNYQFLKIAVNVRKKYHIWDYPYNPILSIDHVLAFTRGDVLAIVSSGTVQEEQDVSNIPYPQGTVICNQLKAGDCLTIGNGGTAHFSVGPDETKIYTRN